MPRTFSRIVQGAHATREDFVPKEPRSVPRNREKARLFSGLSMYETFEHARRTVERFPQIGTCIAEIEVDEDSSIQFERTTTSDGHYTLWGDPDDLLKCVVVVIPL